MDSPQSVVSPFKNSSSVFAELEKRDADSFVRNLGFLSRGIEIRRNGAAAHNLECFLGVLDVYIHQARDIHNICIYQKQDVYAKFCLTNDHENTVSTQIINGGGKNPVFNENLRLNVRKMDTFLKCEIWMLSRVKNYLEDQLLGFALIPLSDVVIRNSKLEKEFSLSSTDLFHSPAGFVQLSLSYSGALPEVMEISALSTSGTTNPTVLDEEEPDSVSCAFDKIEFPDPNIVNENHLMVSEYYGIPCSNLDSQRSDSASTDNENLLTSETGHLAENFSTRTISSISIPKKESPPSSVSTNGSPSASIPTSCQSSDTPRALKSPNEEYDSIPKDHPKEKTTEGGDAESNKFAKPVVTINIEQEEKVVQQDFVNLYMKSMQEFTESLAKMKLPMDIASGPSSSGDSSSGSGQSLQGPKNGGARVFYGSRAFF